jgi:DNA-binding NarL/FixJ family response regulator
MSNRILLVDDHQLIRQGLRALLKSHLPDVDVSEAIDGREAVRLASQLLPDVVIIDLAMPGLNGIDATRQILANNPKTKVIALSAHADPRMVEDVFRAGACAYVPKAAAFEEIAAALHAIQHGQLYLSPALKGAKGIEEFRRRIAEGRTHGIERLTPREREVLQLIAEGKATKEAAAALNLSVKTIETHRRQIMEKLELFSVAELTKYAIREGFTSLDT